MALPTTNISTPIVREALKISENGIWALCNDATVNKWNKYKPVVGNWPQVDGSYGLKRSDWCYYVRTPAKLGHFAGYEANSALVFPPIHSISSQNEIETLYPSSVAAVDNKWKIWCYKSNSDVRLTPDDLGFSNYYYGFKITVGGIIWYKTKGLISDFPASQDTSAEAWVTATLQNPTSSPSFYDLPYGSGTYTWTLILCTTVANSWTTTPPGEIVEFMFDTLGEIDYEKTGTFTVDNWYYASSTTIPQWNYAGNGEQSINIYSNASPWTISGVPGWITAKVYKDGNYISNPALYENDSSLRLECAENTGTTRSDTFFVGSGLGAVNVHVSQASNLGPPTFEWVVNASVNTLTEISNESHGMSIDSANFNLSFDHDHSGDDIWIYYKISDASGTMKTGTGNPNGILLRAAHTAQKSDDDAGDLAWQVQAGTTVTITIGFPDGIPI